MLIIRLRPGIVALVLVVLAGLWLFAGSNQQLPPLTLGLAAPSQTKAAPDGSILISGLPAGRGPDGGDGAGGAGPGGAASGGTTPAAGTETAPTEDRQIYVVQPGDTLSSIARRFQVTVSTLAAANRLADPNDLRPGQELTIPVTGEVSYTVHEGDTLWDIATRFGLEVDAVANLNDLPDMSSLSVGQVLRLPVARSSDPQPEKTQAALSGKSISPLIWPITGRLTSLFGQRWGKMHTGVDIAGTSGQSIRAAKDGVVAAAGTMGGYGLAIKIDHEDGTSTLYAHSSKLLVKKGQRVKQGQVIALVGSTGHSTGPHLHFEVIVRNRSQDPLTYLPKR